MGAPSYHVDGTTDYVPGESNDRACRVENGEKGETPATPPPHPPALKHPPQHKA